MLPARSLEERRNTKPAVHLENLDVLRAVAVLGVVLVHCAGSVWGKSWMDFSGSARTLRLDFRSATSFWLYPFYLGHLGVAIFFAVSGFCIHLSATRGGKQSRGSDFCIKRFFRIVPAYFAVLLALSVHRLHWHDPTAVKSFFLHLFFLHNFDQQSFYGYNPSFWSIAVEMQLYALYPIVCIGARRIGWSRILLLILVIETSLRVGEGVIEAFHGSYLPTWVIGSPFYFWFSWSIGAYAAEKYLRGEGISQARQIGFSLIAMGFITDVWKISAPASFPLVAAGTAFVVAGGPLFPSRWSGPLVIIGTWSYSFYLIQQPFLQKIGELADLHFGRSNGWPLLLVMFTASVLIPVAWLLYWIVERPAIQAGHWVRSKLPVRPVKRQHPFFNPV